MEKLLIITDLVICVFNFLLDIFSTFSRVMDDGLRSRREK